MHIRIVLAINGAPYPLKAEQIEDMFPECEENEVRRAISKAIVNRDIDWLPNRRIWRKQ